jgi:hypothetical protein
MLLFHQKCCPDSAKGIGVAKTWLSSCFMQADQGENYEW